MADDDESTTDSVEQASAEAEAGTEAGAEPTEAGAEPTEVIEKAHAPTQPATPVTPERRFTAPSGYDAGATEQIKRPPEPTTEVISMHGSPSAPTDPVMPTLDPPPAPKQAAPQAIPPRPGRRNRSWGWVVALILVIAALAAVAILGTVALTRGSAPKISKEDQVRSTIQNFDIAVQKGDLASLRSITCGSTRDNYVHYDDRVWADTFARISAAKQYPVVASIDQVIVNGDHAEANVTTFMAYDPQIRSTRSFDLQYRDEQWKICQVPA